MHQFNFVTIALLVFEGLCFSSHVVVYFDQKVVLILNIADILFYLLVLRLVVLVHFIEDIIILDILLPNFANT
jgi:hypothetical protein